MEEKKITETAELVDLERVLAQTRPEDRAALELMIVAFCAGRGYRVA